MGLGKAMAGGGLAADRQMNDWYPTPPDVTRALTIAEDFKGPIWEPACGNGAMSMALQMAGHQVISTDIAPSGYGTRQDFLTSERLTAPNIVTNPPFKLAQQFIEHSVGKLRARKVALVLKSTFWHAKKRTALFHKHMPAKILPLLWRPDFLCLGRPTMEVMWCVWDREYEGFPLYTPLSRPEDPVIVGDFEELDELLEDDTADAKRNVLELLEPA